MSQILKQSTEIKVRIGPFVDVGDAFTPETGVTLTGGGDNADEAEALKANGAATVDISAATWAAISGCDGWYDLTLTTSFTDTVGTLDIIIQNDSVHLPVHARFQVVEEAVFVATYAASASALTPAATANLELDYDGTGYAKANSTIGTTTTNTDMVGTDSALTDKAGFSLSTAGILAVWHQALTAVVTAGSVGKLLKDEITSVRMATLTDWINGGRLDTILDAIKVPTDKMVFGVTNQLNVNTLSWKGSLVTKSALNVPDVNITKTDDGAITSSSFAADAINAAAIAADAATEIGAAVWNAVQSSHVTVGSFGIIASEIAAIPTTAMRGTDSAALASVCTEARLATLTDWIDAGRLDAILDAIKVVTDKFAFTVANQVNANTVSISGDAGAADKLEEGATALILGTVDNTVAPTTTVFEADDITEATADHFNGRIITFTSGALLGQSTDITDYELNGANGKFTVTALTEAPANDVTFLIS